MRKFWAICAVLCMVCGLFAGCGKEDVPEHRTMVYRQAFEHLDGLDTSRISNTVRTEEGYSPTSTVPADSREREKAVWSMCRPIRTGISFRKCR